MYERELELSTYNMYVCEHASPSACPFVFSRKLFIYLYSTKFLLIMRTLLQQTDCVFASANHRMRLEQQKSKQKINYNPRICSYRSARKKDNFPTCHLMTP